jgi:hypothetical protein
MGFRKLANRYERFNIVSKGLWDHARFIMIWKKLSDKFWDRLIDKCPFLLENFKLRF